MSNQRLNHDMLANLYSWWLTGVPEKQDQAPSIETITGWFKSTPELDDQCRTRFGQAVEEAGKMEVSDIRGMVKTPEDAVASVILLDQLPRNIFRGIQAAKAYREYDPKALSLAKTFLGKEFDYGRRDVVSNFFRSYFLYLPLMHSEDMSDHDLLSSLIDKRQDCAESDVERFGVDKLKEFELKHRKVLEQFGRYPSRNKALDRQSTPEEIVYLDGGGGFSG